MTPADDASALARRRIALGRMLFHAGDQLAAVAELDTLQAELPPGTGRARALYHLMYVARSATGIKGAVEYGEQAVVESVDDPAFQAEVLEHLSRVADHDSVLKLDTARMAMAAMARVTDPDPVALFYVRAAVVEAEFHAGLGIHLELLAEAPPDEPPSFPPVRTASRANDLIGRLLAMSGRVDEGREVLRQLHHRAAAENLSILPAVLCWMSELEIIAGRFRSACALSEDALGHAEEIGAAGNLAWVLGRHAIALSYLGRLDDAEQAGMRAVTLAESDPEVGVEETVARLALGAVEMARGRPENAVRHLRVIDDMARQAGIRDPRWFWHSADFVEALLASGDLEGAGEVLERFEEEADRSGGQWSLAASVRCRGLLLAADGRLDEALGSADESLRRFESLPMPFEQARTLLAKGQIHRRRREKKVADLILGQAVEAFTELETPVWAERARAEQRRVGLRPRAGHELTETEHRVALLAAGGMTNRDVANATFMAVKTVENVLARAYHKLGIDSRAELGAWAARAGEHD
jgi:DNA-binding CsgD family transcriptional regulator